MTKLPPRQFSEVSPLPGAKHVKKGEAPPPPEPRLEARAPPQCLRYVKVCVRARVCVCVCVCVCLWEDICL